MALAYTEFDSTPTNILADLRTAITASTDWTRPNSGSEPDTYKATTTRGAEMVFDLADAAVTNEKLQIGVYTSYDGTTFGSKTTKYLYFRYSTSGASSSQPLHCVVSASKEHIFVGIEGPRGGETGAVSTSGGMKGYFFMTDLVPYHAADTDSVVVSGASQMAASPGGSLTNSLPVHISRDYANTSDWAAGRLASLEFPSVSLASQSNNRPQVTFPRDCAIDGKFYLAPYVVFEDAAGIRGRLNRIFYAGVNYTETISAGTAPVGSTVTYGGLTYILYAVSKSDGGQGSTNYWGPLGFAFNSSSFASTSISPVVAIPKE